MPARVRTYRDSIRFKFFLIIGAVLLFSTIAGTAFIVFNERRTLTTFLFDKGHSLGTYVSNISRDPLLLKDSMQLDGIVTEVNKDDDIIFALVQGNDGSLLTTTMASFNDRVPAVKGILAALPKEGDTAAALAAVRKAGIAIELSQPIMIDSSAQGKVLIGLSDAKIRRQLTRTIVYVLIVNISVAAALGIVLFITSKKLILSPISRLCEAARDVASGDLSREIDVTSNDEFGLLTETLNEMITSLNRMVGQVSNATEELNGITGKLTGTAGNVVAAAQLQSEGVANTSSAVMEINAAIKGLTGSVETLSLSAAESSSSILEMTASVDEVAINTETLSQWVAEVSSSITQMAVSIKQVGNSVGNLQEAATSTASSIMEMDLSIREVERNATDASAISDAVRRDAEVGRAAVEATITGINEIKHSSEITSDVINSLSQRTNDIGTILSVIDEVAEQTNLLALNAAIIAAQAGENGKGFAVVADEIKELADRTRVSTREIARVIKGVQDEANRAVTAIRQAEQSIAEGEVLSNKSGSALRQIYAGVERATEQMQKIAGATVEQSKGSRLIRDAMEQVSEMVDQIVRATQEQQQGSETIITSAERMKQLTMQVRNSTHEQSKVGMTIARSTENITGIIGQIKRGYQEQSRGSDQIAAAVEDIQSSSAVNVDATKVMNEATASLFRQIEVLREQMSVFKV
jgi:methyl-accepting chemotaxis protein